MLARKRAKSGLLARLLKEQQTKEASVADEIKKLEAQMQAEKNKLVVEEPNKK